MQPITAASQELATDSRSLTAIAFDRLRTDVIGGHLRPGDRLRVQALCTRYGIGATAIREAPSRLVAEGLVGLEEQRGFHVMPVSRDELADLTEARIDLESLALRRAIEMGDTAWEAEVLAGLHRLSRCPPPVTPDAALTWGRVHRSFHESLLAGARSRWLLALCGLLYDKSERYRCLANLRMPAQSTHRDGEHTVIAEAALARDSTTACRMLASHYRDTTAIILEAKTSAALFANSQPPRSRPRSRACAQANPDP